MVHIIFDGSTVGLDDFYNQRGGGFGETTYFKGVPYQRGYGFQRGGGMGDILRNVWRFLLPVLKTTGSIVGKEALLTGSRVLEKVAEGEKLKNAAMSEGKRGVGNIFDKGVEKITSTRTQSGGGSIKRKRTHKRAIISPHKLVVGSSRFLNKDSRGKKILKSKRKRADAFGFY